MSQLNQLDERINLKILKVLGFVFLSVCFLASCQNKDKESRSLVQEITTPNFELKRSRIIYHPENETLEIGLGYVSEAGIENVFIEYRSEKDKWNRLAAENYKVVSQMADYMKIILKKSIIDKLSPESFMLRFIPIFADNITGEACSAPLIEMKTLIDNKEYYF